MPTEAVASRRFVLAELAATLRRAGIAEPRREALRLWSELSGRPSADVLLDQDASPDPDLVRALRLAAERRAGGEPFAHVVGRTGFRHLVLRSDRRALIPRPETEGLVDLLLARVRTGRAADVGTGTGALALSLASEGGFSTVVGVELSVEALALAAENRARLEVRVELLRGDLCAPLGSGRFDALVSNPPYLSAEEYAALDPSVRDWEPAAALVSGRDGLESTVRLLDEGRAVLHEGGWLALEVDCSRAGQCAGRAAALGWTDIAVHADLFGRDRYLLARRSATT
jgi:release factor glutamine methyltransferase